MAVPQDVLNSVVARLPVDAIRTLMPILPPEAQELFWWAVDETTANQSYAADPKKFWEVSANHLLRQRFEDGRVPFPRTPLLAYRLLYALQRDVDLNNVSLRREYDGPANVSSEPAAPFVVTVERGPTTMGLGEIELTVRVPRQHAFNGEYAGNTEFSVTLPALRYRSRVYDEITNGMKRGPGGHWSKTLPDISDYHVTSGKRDYSDWLILRPVVTPNVAQALIRARGDVEAAADLIYKSPA